MPRGLNFGIEVRGDERAADRLDGIAHRMQNAQPAFEDVARILEAGEQRHFDSLRGRYVRTGALRDSLTEESANGAIREAHGDSLTFGTSIFYARFLRRKKKSAVLVLKPLERKQASQAIMDFVTGGDL